MKNTLWFLFIVFLWFVLWEKERTETVQCWPTTGSQRHQRKGAAEVGQGQFLSFSQRNHTKTPCIKFGFLVNRIKGLNPRLTKPNTEHGKHHFLLYINHKRMKRRNSRQITTPLMKTQMKDRNFRKKMMNEKPR